MSSATIKSKANARYTTKQSEPDDPKVDALETQRAKELLAFRHHLRHPTPSCQVPKDLREKLLRESEDLVAWASKASGGGFRAGAGTEGIWRKEWEQRNGRSWRSSVQHMQRWAASLDQRHGKDAQHGKTLQEELEQAVAADEPLHEQGDSDRENAGNDQGLPKPKGPNHGKPVDEAVLTEHSGTTLVVDNSRAAKQPISTNHGSTTSALTQIEPLSPTQPTDNTSNLAFAISSASGSPQTLTPARTQALNQASSSAKHGADVPITVSQSYKPITLPTPGPVPPETPLPRDDTSRYQSSNARVIADESSPLSGVRQLRIDNHTTDCGDSSCESRNCISCSRTWYNWFREGHSERRAARKRRDGEVWA